MVQLFRNGTKEEIVAGCGSVGDCGNPGLDDRSHAALGWVPVALASSAARSHGARGRAAASGDGIRPRPGTSAPVHGFWMAVFCADGALAWCALQASVRHRLAEAYRDWIFAVPVPSSATLQA